MQDMPSDFQRRGRRQARTMRMINVPMRAILGLPIPTPLGRNLMLAFITGRKTGHVYRQPLSYVRDGDTLLTPGGGKWKLNLQDGKPVRLRIRGRIEYATPELIKDQPEVEAALNVVQAGNPNATRFMPIPRLDDGRLDPEAMARAITYGFCIVRWHLTDKAAA